MNAHKSMGKLPYALIIIIIIFTVFGMLRRCRIDGSNLVDSYTRPGGDTLSVAIEMSPLTYTLRHDTASGFDYDLLSAICRSHDIVLRLRPVSDLDRAFLGLHKGTYDLLVASIPASTPLKEHFPLTDALYVDRQVLVQLRDSSGNAPVRRPRSLLDDTVWIADGSPLKSRIDNLAGELGGEIHIESMPGYSQETLARMTALGELRHAVVNEAVARRVAADYPQLDISLPLSLTRLQCWAVAPGDSTLLDSLNTWIAQYQTTAAYDSLTQRYDVVAFRRQQPRVMK